MTDISPNQPFLNHQSTNQPLNIHQPIHPFSSSPMVNAPMAGCPRPWRAQVGKALGQGPWHQPRGQRTLVAQLTRRRAGCGGNGRCDHGSCWLGFTNGAGDCWWLINGWLMVNAQWIMANGTEAWWFVKNGNYQLLINNGTESTITWQLNQLICGSFAGDG